MSRAHAYPPDLASYVEANWPPARPLWLPSKLFAEALSMAFQASMTSDEGRPTRFRLLLTPFEALPEHGEPNQGVLRLRFDQSRPLNADELRRLSPSAPFETCLIGAHVEDGRLRIWGVAHSGPAWLAPTWGGRSAVPNWTYDPIVHVTAPGQIAVRCAGQPIGALERGEVVAAILDVFDSEWLRAMFERERERVRLEHASRQSASSSPTLVEHSLIGRVSQHMLRRTIQLIRGARHGGMLLVVDNVVAPAGLTSLRLKYRFHQDEPSQRYRTLLFRILESLAASSSKPSVDWSDFALDASMELEQLERAVFEWSRVLASLSAVDGAVVIDKRLGLLGFGAEVSPELPAPARVWRALDAEGRERSPDDIENVGTRHRAAYRFVKEHPQGLAVVVSHDGGVSFVANREQEVVFWEQSVSP
jgi:DisA bacterial checkpoint controller nucleotide-binding